VALLPAKVQVLPAAAKAQLPRERGWDLERPHALAAAFCRERHIEYVDMLPDFRRLARAGTKLYFSKDEHLTREGHALAARLLAPRLRDLKGESPSPR